MRRSFRTGLAGVSTLVAAGGILAATALPAAASFPGTSWQPDPQAVGTLAFYNSAGQQITSGTDDSHLFDYALASTTDPSSHPGLSANLLFANPTTGTTSTWSVHADESSSSSDSSAPGILGTSPNPLMETDSAGANLQVAASGFIPSQPAGETNVYQVRVYTSGGGGTGASKYWDADVKINPSNNSWVEVDGSPVSSTVTAVGGSPNPTGQGSTVTLSATVTMADGSTPAGSVDFKNGATDLGSTTTFTGGVASVTTTVLPQGSDTITATFTPSNTGTVTYTGSSNTGTETISAPATPTTTTLTVTQDGHVGDDVGLNSTVSPSGAAGTVSWYDNNSPTALNPSPVTVVSGAASFDIPSGLAAGGHSIVAKFTPSNPASFNASQSQPSAFVLSVPLTGACAQQGSVCSETQSIETEIPVGTLVINTPYTSGNPLNLGPMSLNPAGTEFNASAPFECITVTDTTSGHLPWTAQALASALNDSNPPSGATVTSINAENVGLTGFTKPTSGDAPTCTDTQTYTGTVVTADNPAAEPAVPVADTGSAGLGGTTAHTFATGSGGDGTSTIDGLLTINAPTSNAAGTYTGTITFTVSD